MRARRIGNAGGNTTGWIRSARPAAHTGAWLAIVTADDDRKKDVRFTLKFMSTDFQVLIGPDENDGLGPWYFSLNNRRLWVLKQTWKLLKTAAGSLRTAASGDTAPDTAPVGRLRSIF